MEKTLNLRYRRRQTHTTTEMSTTTDALDRVLLSFPMMCSGAGPEFDSAVLRTALSKPVFRPVVLPHLCDLLEVRERGLTIAGEDGDTGTCDVCLDASALADVVLAMLENFTDGDYEALQFLCGLTDDRIAKALLEMPVDMLPNRDYYVAQATVSRVSFIITLTEALTRSVCIKNPDAQHNLDFHEPYSMLATTDFDRLRDTMSKLDQRDELKEGIRHKKMVCPIPHDEKPFTVTRLEERMKKGMEICSDFSDVKFDIHHKSRGLLDESFFRKFGANVVAAGGSVNNAFQKYHRPDTKSDIDLFFHGVLSTSHAARLTAEMVDHIFEGIKNGDPHHDVVLDITRNSVNITLLALDTYGQLYTDLEIQIVTRLFTSIRELLVFFDHGACRFAYDGRRLYATASALFAQQNGHFVIDVNLLTYVNRLLKYAKRGYTCLCPVTQGYMNCVSHVFGLRHSDAELRQMVKGGKLLALLAFRVMRSRWETAEEWERPENGRTKLNDAPATHEPKGCLSGKHGRVILNMVDPRCDGGWYAERLRAGDIVWQYFPVSEGLRRCFLHPQEDCKSREMVGPGCREVLTRAAVDQWRWKVDQPCVNLVGDGSRYCEIP